MGETTLMHDVQHHAKDKANVIYALALLFATELNPEGWQAYRQGKGNNSWRIYLDRPGKPTKTWYFTGYHKGTVMVRNDYHWKNSSRRFTITTRTDCARFAVFAIKDGRR